MPSSCCKRDDVGDSLGEARLVSGGVDGLAGLSFSGQFDQVVGTRQAARHGSSECRSALFFMATVLSACAGEFADAMVLAVADIDRAIRGDDGAMRTRQAGLLRRSAIAPGPGRAIAGDGADDPGCASIMRIA